MVGLLYSENDSIRNITSARTSPRLASKSCVPKATSHGGLGVRGNRFPDGWRASAMMRHRMERPRSHCDYSFTRAEQAITTDETIQSPVGGAGSGAGNPWNRLFERNTNRPRQWRHADARDNSRRLLAINHHRPGSFPKMARRDSGARFERLYRENGKYQDTTSCQLASKIPRTVVSTQDGL